MANHNIEVPGWLDNEYVTHLIKKQFSSSTIKILSKTITPGSQVGDNYCCQIVRMQIEAEVDDQLKHLSIIGKITPKTKLLESLGERIEVFEVEAKAFDTLFPKLKKYLPEQKILPESYHVDFDRQAIFMEDLKTAGFELRQRGEFLDLKQCLLAVGALAEFHGMSWYALQDDPGLKTQYHKSFWDGTTCDSWHKMLDNAQFGIESHIGLYDLNDDLKKKMLNFRKSAYEIIPSFEKSDSDMNSLCHGDCWMNNMLFHYGQDGVADDVRLIDFQIIYFGNIFNDLNYFIFTSACADVIVNNLDQLVEHYYNRLKTVAPNVPGLTLERVQHCFKDRISVGYLMLFAFRPFLSANSNALGNVLNGEKDIESFVHPRFIQDVLKIFPVINDVMAL